MNRTAVNTPSSRRRFLKSTALAALGLALFPATRSGASTRAGGKSVIVVGAGVSGLAAAKALSEAGLVVVVLEARERAGGRVWTDRSLGLPADLGASWIHGSSGNPITALARKYKAKSSKSNYDNTVTYLPDGSEIDDAVLNSADDNFQSLSNAVLSSKSDLSADISLAAGFDKVLANQKLSEEGLQIFRWEQSTNLVGDIAADLDKVSLLAYDTDEAFNGPDLFMTAGYDRLPSGLAQNLDIRFQTIVSSIDYSNGVRVSTNNGTFNADYCVVTLPLGVLKSGKVTFTPALPAAKLAAISKLGVGLLNKLVLKFPSVFWNKKVDFLEYISAKTNEFPEWINVYKYTRQPVLIATNAGGFAENFETLSDADAVSAAMSVLKRIYGSSIPDPVGSINTRWRSDPFAFGSYSYNAVGSSLKDNAILGDPVNNTLFFAGEATNDLYPATVHGAYLSGLREADRIASLI